ncbi:MAG TPA: hypothetical protein VG106_04510, partial [Vicinamibacterales bacterium]|nr:hypothetical protein [Vicinamibacterales bacterium]
MNTRTPILVAMLLLGIACSKEETQQAQTKAEKVAQKVEDAIDIAVPLGDKDDPAAREKERFDESWRDIFRDVKVGQVQGPQQPDLKITFVPNGKESFKNLTPEQINNAPVVVPIKGDVSGPSVLKTQVYLDRLNFSVGVMDGRWGRNSAIALWWYQRSRGIDAADPGALDEATFRSLAASAGGVPVLVQHTITEE